MKSNARKTVQSEAESGFSIGSDHEAASSKHPSKLAGATANDSFSTPMVSSPTFKDAGTPTPEQEKQKIRDGIRA